MRSLGSRSVLGVVVSLTVTTALFGGCGRGARAPEAHSEPSRVSTVTLERYVEALERRRLVVTDRATIDALLELARFETKDVCKCAHTERISFATDSGPIEASLCSHCFDVADAGRVAYYAMTPEFYAEFRRLVDAAPPVPAR